jgi:ABC-type transport system involved in multi-copper enzyme maturation permease subunit
LQLEGENIDLLNNMTGIMSLIMPVDGLQRKMSAELLSLDELNGMVGFISGTGGLMDISTAPANSFVVYAVCYTLLAFLIGLLRFQRKDL